MKETSKPQEARPWREIQALLMALGSQEKCHSHLSTSWPLDHPRQPVHLAAAALIPRKRTSSLSPPLIQLSF